MVEEPPTSPPHPNLLVSFISFRRRRSSKIPPSVPHIQSFSCPSFPFEEEDGRRAPTPSPTSNPSRVIHFLSKKKRVEEPPTSPPHPNLLVSFISFRRKRW